MKNIEQAIKFYYATSKLKRLLRSGPVIWRVDSEIKETVADHIYGTLMLCISLRDVLDIKFNFEKTFLMLALHEVEEIVIGDITPLDKSKTEDEKKVLGEQAVASILEILGDSYGYAELLREFNEGTTNESRVAKACDKLECVLEFKKYCDEGSVSLNNATEKMLESKSLRAFYDEGKYALDDIFYIYHMKKYEDLGFTPHLWFDVIKKVDSNFLIGD